MMIVIVFITYVVATLFATPHVHEYLGEYFGQEVYLPTSVMITAIATTPTLLVGMLINNLVESIKYRRKCL